MIKRSIVPLLPEPGRTMYVQVDERRYRIRVKSCAQTCRPGTCENFSLTHPEWSTYEVVRALFGETQKEDLQDLKPLICFHGFSESAYTWEQVYLPGYRLYCIDFLGHGGSSCPEQEEAYSYERALKDIHAIIQSHVGVSYSLMGYSQGARFALLYALTYGHEVEALVLESGSVGIEDRLARKERANRDGQLAQAIEDEGIAWFEETWRQVPIFATQATLPQDLQERIRLRRRHNHPRGLAQALRATGQGVMPYVGNRLHELRMPTLYVCGEEDDKYKAIGHRFFAHCLEEIPGVGHNTHLENPEEFSDRVHSFLVNHAIID